MKKRIIAFFATILIALPMVIATASAAEVQPRWSLINDMTALCIIDDDYYYASVTSNLNVNKMDIDVVLYEKGLLTSYKEVSRISKTVNNYHHSCTNSYNFSSLKDYKVVLTVN